jgi:hypothetical protein
LQGTREDDLIYSLSPENNRLQIFKTNRTMIEGMSTNNGGKSNSFFFFTEDKKYMIKTMNKEEFRVLIKILPDLANHVKN